MEEEGPINFKALRAKFQEEALLAQSRNSRPAVAEKPKLIPPPGGHCSSMVDTINSTVENKTPVIPGVIFRDALRVSGGKRPISFPPQPLKTSPPSQVSNIDSVTRQSLKERHLPLVLPVLSVKEQKVESPVKKEQNAEQERVKELLPQTRIKKKGLLLPFKSVKASKVGTENGEDPTYAELTTRPCSAPGELPSVEQLTTGDGDSVQSDQSTAECPLSSPDLTSPHHALSNADFENRLISTLERAKKKFSCRQILISTKPKSLLSPEHGCKDKPFCSPPKSSEVVERDLPLPPPIYLPHLACISARPFCKVNNSTRKSPLEKQFGKDKAQLLSGVTDISPTPTVPPKYPLPDLRTLGLQPAKPPRPPLVDLSSYQALHEVSPGLDPLLPGSEEPRSAQPVNFNTALDAPEFPEFDNTEIEPMEGERVDLAAIELEALTLVSTNLPAPLDFRFTDFEEPGPDSSVCDRAKRGVNIVDHDLKLGSQSIMPLDPARFPEPTNLPEFPEPFAPEQWSQSEEAVIDPPPNSQADGNDLRAVECHSAPEETELGDHSINNGYQPHIGVYQQGSYCDRDDNVYEDVENVNKFILIQNSRKFKTGIKNPYAESKPVKEEVHPKMWSRNSRLSQALSDWMGGICELPSSDLSTNILWSLNLGFDWGTLGQSVTFPGAAPVLSRLYVSGRCPVESKERQSPNTADHKEQKKKEKQRLEKEKKEQKEREKKENEMKKKFKVTGDEEPMYHAKVKVTSKVRKNDLPVKSGDTVSIIRTTNCPKGKWLAQDDSHRYGYISVMNVELNMKDVLELGKKAQAAGRGGPIEADTVSIGSRCSSHPVLTSSFTDDSEEWSCEDETLSPSNGSHCPQHNSSIPDVSCGLVSAQHTLSDAYSEDQHAQHEALQKLAVFFQHNKNMNDTNECADVLGSEGATPTNPKSPNFLCAVEEPPYLDQELDLAELELLPPPPLYADAF
ncbi:uncharacterized protein si:ch211-188c16.1 isoform X2 [Betta splendens]|uniref:Uncharacterized protein si:ch211-188c16.1 isoform X2 n=1 Tax=Betta splendens TaxID=158456 RepID=A0A6P7L1S2_BETSP|nr:uncharacterized protein si:ch211-188c16.1 isoform X2 [Betta splendens]